MDSPQQIKEPILVKNPHTGRFINIAPLFDTMEEMDGPGSPAQNMKEVITQALRYINLAVVNDSTTPNVVRVGLNYDLYRLEDMFNSMAEFKQ